MKQIAVILLASVLGGCASYGVMPAPQPPITVEKPIPVPCVKAEIPKPEFPDGDTALKSAPDTFTRIKLIVAGRLLRIAYETKLEAALAACK